MRRAAAAAALYFAIVYGVGFALGPIRVLWLEPRLGATVAVLCEAPLLLLAIVLAALWVPRRMGLGGDRAALWGMGIVALALQQAADLALGVVLRGISPADQLRQFATPTGLVYAALLLAFAAMPALLGRGSQPEA
jgi:hypothetical protein